MGDRTLANKITIDLNDQKVYIDGESFPYWLEGAGPRVEVMLPGSGGRMAVVYLPVLVGAVEVLPEAQS